MSTCRSVLFWIFTWWCKYFRLVRTYVPIRQLYLAYVIRTGTNCCPVCVENTINRSQSVTFFISSMVVQEQYSHAVSCASDRIHCHLNIYKLKLNWNYTFTYFFRKKKKTNPMTMFTKLSLCQYLSETPYHEQYGNSTQGDLIHIALWLNFCM